MLYHFNLSDKIIIVNRHKVIFLLFEKLIVFYCSSLIIMSPYYDAIKFESRKILPVFYFFNKSFTVFIQLYNSVFQIQQHTSEV